MKVRCRPMYFRKKKRTRNENVPASGFLLEKRKCRKIFSKTVPKYNLSHPEMYVDRPVKTEVKKNFSALCLQYTYVTFKQNK